MLRELIDQIIDRVGVNLRDISFDLHPYTHDAVPLDNFLRFYAFYGLTGHHKLHFRFTNSSLAGSYFLGQCIVENSIVYKSDIRGDELRNRGEIYHHQGLAIRLHSDEYIRIQDSFLIKALVHNNSHDPERPEEFLIRNVVAMPYANIHGSPMEGCFMGAFSTMDLTTVHDCALGAFAYVQVGELAHTLVEPGRVWVQAGRQFDFDYRFDRGVLDHYIRQEKGQEPQGLLLDFVEERKDDFKKVFDSLQSDTEVQVPDSASLSRYAVFEGNSTIAENVLVAQRSFVKNSRLGPGANTQEHCYVIDSRLDGLDVTAHGGKVICARLGVHVFVGFNAFLRGSASCPLTIGPDCIVMPHTIIDLDQPLEIPADTLVWGFIRNSRDLEENSIPLSRLEQVDGELKIGAMKFRGNGRAFVQAFRSRIDHILEANGAFFDGNSRSGHAQKDQRISFNTIQPYPDGPRKGIYPSMEILP